MTGQVRVGQRRCRLGQEGVLQGTSGGAPEVGAVKAVPASAQPAGAHRHDPRDNADRLTRLEARPSKPCYPRLDDSSDLPATDRPARLWGWFHQNWMVAVSDRVAPRTPRGMAPSFRDERWCFSFSVASGGHSARATGWFCLRVLLVRSLLASFGSYVLKARDAV